MVPNIRVKGFNGDWEVRSLGEIYTERNERGDDSLQILSVSIHDGVSDGELDEEGLGKVVRRSEDKTTYKHVYEGDLVFNMMRAWQGAIGVVKTEGMISPAYISAIPNENVYPPFMDYTLRRKEAISQINNLSYGVTDFRKRLYWDSFVKVRCSLPSVKEQRKIADTLEGLDEYILLSRKQCDDLIELKKYMLQKMFPKDGEKVPKIRFAGFEGEWEQRKLGDICERVTRKNKNGESDLPLTIASQYGLIDQRDFFNKVVAAKDMSNYYLLKQGEFAYNKSYSNGFDYGSIKRLNAYAQGCLSTLYICFGITSDDLESDYLECFFDTLKWYSNIAMICAEGARNHGLLNVDTKAFFEEVTIEMPSSKEEQRKISAYLNTLDSLITHHQRKHDALLEFKAYLLQNMFPKEV